SSRFLSSAIAGGASRAAIMRVPTRVQGMSPFVMAVTPSGERTVRRDSQVLSVTSGYGVSEPPIDDVMMLLPLDRCERDEQDPFTALALQLHALSPQLRNEMAAFTPSFP